MSHNESILEDAVLEWFGELGYAVGHGPHSRALRGTLLMLFSGELIVVNSEQS